MMTEKGFELRGVSVGESNQRRLDDVSVDIPASGITVLAGPSGAGKSTLLRLLNRLDVADQGSVRWQGSHLDDLDVLAHRRQVGMVFQKPTAVPGTVADNIRLAAPAMDDDAVVGLLATVALDAGFLNRNALELSGGERQLVLLARALVQEPKLLLLDEPTAFLDLHHRTMVLRLIRELADEQGCAALVVSHDVTLAARACDRLLLLHERHDRSADDKAACLRRRTTPPTTARLRRVCCTHRSHPSNALPKALCISFPIDRAKVALRYRPCAMCARHAPSAPSGSAASHQGSKSDSAGSGCWNGAVP